MIQNILKGIYGIIQIIFVGSFLLMVINIMFYYGFRMEMHHSKNPLPNPMNLKLWQIWSAHLISGTVAGIFLNPKRFLLAGFCGMLAAGMVTGFTFIYLGWRESFEIFEILFPLILGILPAVKLYDFLNKRFPIKS